MSYQTHVGHVPLLMYVDLNLETLGVAAIVMTIRFRSFCVAAIVMRFDQN